MSEERRQDQSRGQTEHGPFEPLSDEFLRCANQFDRAAKSLSERFSRPTVFAEFLQLLPPEPVAFEPQIIPKHRDLLTFILNVPLGLFDTLIDRCLIEAPSLVTRLKEIYGEVLTEARHLITQLDTPAPIDLANWFRFINSNIPFAARRLRRMATLLRPNPDPLNTDGGDGLRIASVPIDQGTTNADGLSMERDQVKAHLAEQHKPTPETDTSLIYQAAASEFYNIPKSLLSKAAKKKPGEFGYLWSDTVGRRRWYRKSDLQRIAQSREKLRGS